MAINFPDPATQTPVNEFGPNSSPAVSPNDVLYIWDGVKWDSEGISDLDSRFVNVPGDTMTGALTLPQAIVPGVPVGWAQFTSTGITAVDLAAQTPAYNVIDRVTTGSPGTFRIYLKAGEEMPWNDFFVVVNPQTTSDSQTNASVHRDTANWPDNTLPCDSVLVKTVRLIPGAAISADNVGCSVLIYMRG